MGVKQSLHTLVEAAKILEARRSDIQVLLVGDGAVRRSLEATIKALALRNVHILPTQSPSDYQELLSDLEICVIPQARGAGEAFFPSKLLGILARGRPVIIAADPDSELASAGRDSGGAQIVPAEDPRALADAILALHERDGRRATMSAVAVQYLRQFDRSELLGEFERLLVEAAANHGRAPVEPRADGSGNHESRLHRNIR
jgi:colanic acid biosynthesis glycosyl transferase WcaI